MQISMNNLRPLNGFPNHSSSMYKLKLSQPISFHPSHLTTITTTIAKGLKACATWSGMSFSGVKYGISVKRVFLVKSGLNELGGGRKISARVLGNLGVAILLTYLTMTDQLGWLLDAIVSIWFAIGAFLWWAGTDILQSTCPNCGNEFQVFKSTLKDELQMCPFCTQPFSVVGSEFVSEPVKFFNQAMTFDQRVSDFSPCKKKGQDSSMAVVDVVADIRDVE